MSPGSGCRLDVTLVKDETIETDMVRIEARVMRGISGRTPRTSTRAARPGVGTASASLALAAILCAWSALFTGVRAIRPDVPEPFRAGAAWERLVAKSGVDLEKTVCGGFRNARFEERLARLI